MPTTTVKTIGTASRQYSTLQAWEDACPANLVTNDEIWKGECYNDSEFTASSGTLISFSGVTADNTRYLWLTTASGQGFKDASGADADDLRYDQTRGVAARITGSYTSGVDASGSGGKVLIENIQFQHDDTGGNGSWGIKGGFWRGCLLESKKSGAFSDISAGASVLINCLVVSRSSSAAPTLFRALQAFYNCTIVRPSDLTSAGTAMTNYSSLYPTVKNTAVFGFATNFGGTIGSYPAGGYNASSVADTPGANDQASLTYSSQFENVSDATRDWRVKTGNGLAANATRAQGTEGDLSTLGTNDKDILGRTRSTTAPTIGCWEVISGGGDQTITLGDTAAGADALAIAVALAMADTATGAEGFAGSASVPLADTGAGADALSITVTFTVADTGAGADDVSIITAELKTIAESAAGSDALAITVSAALPETGAGADGLTIAASLTLADTGAGVDALSVITETLISIAETFAAVDALGGITVQVNLPETGSGVDATALQALVAVLETASGLDVAIVINPDAARIVRLVFTPRGRSVSFTLH